jgi:hypothetical protein
MKNLFVPYELAKLAKEKGFCVYTAKNNHPVAPPENEHCLGWYEIRSEEADKYDIPNWKERDGKFHYSGTPINNANLGSGVVAPLYQQLVDWFRNEHKIFININKEALGSDEWENSFTIEYLPKEFWNEKRRIQHFITINSFSLTGGATYIGAWDNYYHAWDMALEKSFELI